MFHRRTPKISHPALHEERETTTSTLLAGRGDGMDRNASRWPGPKSTSDILEFSNCFIIKIEEPRMSANAQRDGRPAEYRWRPLFNAAKFGWRPLLQCRAVMLPRHETRSNLLGCPKLANRSQPLVGRSSPYYENTWKRYCCLISFFRLSMHALFAKIQPNKVVRLCRNGDFLRPVFQWAACSSFQTCILNSH